jgi:hypothetical protein
MEQRLDYLPPAREEVYYDPSRDALLICTDYGGIYKFESWNGTNTAIHVFPLPPNMLGCVYLGEV